MKSISFKNFRRFENFPEFKFGDITILVGGNNAGKSTLQKALLLVFDNLKTLKKKASAFNIFDDGFSAPEFRFDANQFHNLNLGTFSRALYSGATKRAMEFTLCIESFDIRIEVEPDAAGENLPIAKVSIIEVNDTKRHILYTFNFTTKRMSVEFEQIQGNGTPEFDKIQNRIAELRATLEKEEDVCEAALANQELEKLLAVRNAFVDSNVEARESSRAETGINNYLGIKGEKRTTSSTLAGYIENLEAYTWTIGAKLGPKIELEEEESLYVSNASDKQEIVINGTEEDRANEQVLGDKNSLLIESARALESELSTPHIYYIQAHGVSQKMLYTLDERNDSMAQAIHNYARFGVNPGTFADSFIRRWMKEFGIGSNYKIESFGGEGYTVTIETAKGWVNLVDMGMGTNQLMVMLFNLATIMLQEGHHGADGGKSFVPKFIIIEEPEQNLHPKLQSKLADLFAEVAKDDSYKFLIETHSEYLIRRTQVLVSKGSATENPFKVYYFPEAGLPYDMGYTASGRFENKFGEGFFDESAKWHMEILRKEKEMR